LPSPSRLCPVPQPQPPLNLPASMVPLCDTGVAVCPVG